MIENKSWGKKERKVEQIVSQLYIFLDFNVNGIKNNVDFFKTNYSFLIFLKILFFYHMISPSTGT